MDALRVPRAAHGVRGLLVHRQIADVKPRPRDRLWLAYAEFQFAAHLGQLRDQVFPLPHAQEAEILGFADATQRIVAWLAVHLEHAVPNIERGEEITARIGVPIVDPVSFLAFIFGALPWVLQAEERDDDQHSGKRVRRGAGGRFDDHAPESDVDWDMRQLSADAGQFDFAVFMADGLELGQLVEPVGHGTHIRRVDEAEMRDVIDRVRHADRQHVQHHRAQRRAQDFRLGEAWPRLVILVRIQANRDAVGYTPASAGTLVGARLRNRFNRQTLHFRRFRIP